jgi:hypothetical protein
MDLKGMGCQDVNCIHLTQGRANFRVLVNMVINVHSGFIKGGGSLLSDHFQVRL